MEDAGSSCTDASKDLLEAVTGGGVCLLMAPNEIHVAVVSEDHEEELPEDSQHEQPISRECACFAIFLSVQTSC